jgi:hypothetical protein
LLLHYDNIEQLPASDNRAAADDLQPRVSRSLQCPVLQDQLRSSELAIEVKLLTDTRQNVKSYGWDAQTTFLISSRNILTAGASWFFDHSRDSRVSRSDAGIIGFATRPPAPPAFIPVPRIAFGPPSVTFPQRVPKSGRFRSLADARLVVDHLFLESGLSAWRNHRRRESLNISSSPLRAAEA